MNAMHRPVEVQRRIVIAGGGLAGVVAALVAAEEAAKHKQRIEVVLVEKQAKLGGNSVVSSRGGVNAVNAQGNDSATLFKQDTIQAGGGINDPDLVDVLVDNSAAALQFLKAHNISLPNVTQGHGSSVPRTFISRLGLAATGPALVRSLIYRVLRHEGIIVHKGCKLAQITKDDSGVSAVQLEYITTDGKGMTVQMAAHAVILATGSYSANTALIKMYASAAAHLATSAGDWSTGDGIVLAKSLGGSLVDMSHVEVYPLAFVVPQNPAAPTKEMVPLELLKLGALLINHQGKRFVNELLPPQQLTKAVLQQVHNGNTKLFLLISKSVARDYGAEKMQELKAKDKINKVEDGSEAADVMDVTRSTLVETLHSYNKAADVGKDEFGRTEFPGSTWSLGAPMYIAVVTPVIHHTWGGVEILPTAQVVEASGGGVTATARMLAGRVPRKRAVERAAKARADAASTWATSAAEDEWDADAEAEDDAATVATAGGKKDGQAEERRASSLGAAGDGGGVGSGIDSGLGTDAGDSKGSRDAGAGLESGSAQGGELSSSSAGGVAKRTAGGADAEGKESRASAVGQSEGEGAADSPAVSKHHAVRQGRGTDDEDEEGREEEAAAAEAAARASGFGAEAGDKDPNPGATLAGGRGNDDSSGAKDTVVSNPLTTDGGSSTAIAAAEARAAEDRRVVPGLYAAGEVAGGVHGSHWLEGNVMLECIVFGRIAAQHAVMFVAKKQL